MPRVFWRLVAVVLLALAVPIQGVAGVAAGQCMAFGHHDAGSDDHHAHGSDDHPAHAHADGTEHGGEDAGHSHCGPCTSCCASASIAGPVGLPIPSSPSNAQYVFAQFSPLGVPPHGPYRPPLAL